MAHGEPPPIIQEVIAAGVDVDDLRGITHSADKNDSHVGLIHGTGGEAVEYLGEWDLPLNGVLYTASTCTRSDAAEAGCSLPALPPGIRGT